MVEARRELVRAWLAKALHDLGTARKAAADPDPYLDTAVYHCQQVAEKSLKAFLTFHDVLFDKTHNLGSLLVQAAAIDSSFMGLADAAETLTPLCDSLSVSFRFAGAESGRVSRGDGAG